MVIHGILGVGRNRDSKSQSGAYNEWGSEEDEK